MLRMEDLDFRTKSLERDLVLRLGLLGGRTSQ